MSQAELEAAWPQALAAMDQPSIDGFNVFLVSRFAREAGLKVVLSGLGGDELFGSYPSFRDVPRWHRWARMGRPCPAWARAWQPLAPAWRGAAEGCGASWSTAAASRAPISCAAGCCCPKSWPDLLGPRCAREALQAYDPLADLRGRSGPEAATGRPCTASRPGCTCATSSCATQTGPRWPTRWSCACRWSTCARSAALAQAAFEPARSAGKAALVRQVAPELPATLLGGPSPASWCRRRGSQWPQGLGPAGATAGAGGARPLRHRGRARPTSAAGRSSCCRRPSTGPGDPDPQPHPGPGPACAAAPTSP